MTIQIENGWVQYDNQIGTFRGERNGVIYGEYTGEFSTAINLIVAMNVSIKEKELEDLQNEKVGE